MSRGIKFRVYSSDYKKYLDSSGKGIFCEVHHLALKPDGKLYYADIGIEYPGTLSECPTLKWEEDYKDCTVEQFTGLLDRNGKEIYEGDIIKCYSQDTYPIGRVIYSEEYAEYEIVAYDAGSLRDYSLEHFSPVINKYLEVIGNIHENPGLLETK